MNALHISTARKILESGNKIDIRCWKSDGEIISYNQVLSTSSNFKNNSVNVRLENGQIRKIKIVTIFEINNIEIYL